MIVVNQAQKIWVSNAQKLLEMTQAGKVKIVYLNRNDAKDNKKSGNLTEI